MKISEVKKRLARFGEAVNAITDGKANYGGCCVIASIAADALDAIGVKARGVVATTFGESIDAARPENSEAAGPREWNRNGLRFYHVGLEVAVRPRPLLFDSEGMVPRAARDESQRLPGGMWPLIPGYLSRAELRALAGRADGWNSTFPRRVIPKIRQAAKRILVEGAES